MEWKKGDEEGQGNIQRNRAGRRLRKDQEDGQKAAKTKAQQREKRKNLRTHLRTLRKMTMMSSNNLTGALPHTQPTKQTNRLLSNL
ncbi:Glucosidase 2 subunit beta [Labeo rohita]|uniref:Glucosidase 2 subunit beta n=1 Tax=Labeo rohita TaxID=84645 RepID=A0ABQ8MNF5_LABRO|nr:Glucosidase 2 subunit beta [Labeo rohita]